VPSWLRYNVFETLRGKQLALQLWTDPSGIATGRLYQDATGKIEAPHILTDRLLTFAVAVRGRQYGKGHQVQVQSVVFALRAVAQKYVLDGYPDPRCASPAQQSLDLPIARLLKKYDDEDPPPEPKLAVPISTITTIVEKYRWTAHLSAVADLVIIAFFYLLRVGEYTSPATPRKKRTIPLRDCNIRLWNIAGHLISHSAGLEMLSQAYSATICISHTKNETKGAVVHHSCGQGSICPVAALARRVANIQAGPANRSVNLVYHTGGRISRVSDRDIGIAVRWGATWDNLISKDYTLNHVSSHNLLAG